MHLKGRHQKTLVRHLGDVKHNLPRVGQATHPNGASLHVDLKKTSKRAETDTDMFKDASLVPSARFGALLSQQRRDSKLPLAELAARSVRYSVRDLQKIERGRVQLSDTDVKRVASIYGVELGTLIQERQDLYIDFGHRQLTVGEQNIELDSTDRTEILTRYLTLVQFMRGVEPGEPMVFRRNDIETLAVALGLNEKSVTQSLRSINKDSAESLRRWREEYRNRLVIPGAGVLVAAASFGTLLFAPPASATAAPSVDTEASGGADFPTLRSAKGAGTDVADLSNAYRDETGHEALGRKAEALLPAVWRSHTPGWSISYQPTNGEASGITDADRNQITVFVSTQENPALVAANLAHEVGHAIDFTVLTDTERSLWSAARRLKEPWWPSDDRTLDPSDTNYWKSGAADFAEAVAQTWTGSPNISDRGRISDSDRLLLEILIRR